jgi:hypothetical protein
MNTRRYRIRCYYRTIHYYNNQIHGSSLVWLGTDIRGGEVKIDWWTQTPHLVNWCGHTTVSVRDNLIFTWLLTLLAWLLYKTANSLCLALTHDRSLSLPGSYAWPLTLLAWLLCMTAHSLGLAVIPDRLLSRSGSEPGQESERSCIRARPREWTIMLKSQAKGVGGHVIEPGQESKRSYIRTRQREWTVMHKCQAKRVRKHDPSPSWHGS